VTRDEWERIPWHARNKAIAARRRQIAHMSVVERARLIQTGTPPDLDAAAHVELLHHYTSTPRKRTA
jgi:hypothetical protein